MRVPGSLGAHNGSGSRQCQEHIDFRKNKRWFTLEPMGDHGLSTHIQDAPNSTFQCGNNSVRFYSNRTKTSPTSGAIRWASYAAWGLPGFLNLELPEDRVCVCSSQKDLPDSQNDVRSHTEVGCDWILKPKII